MNVGTMMRDLRAKVAELEAKNKELEAARLKTESDFVEAMKSLTDSHVKAFKKLEFEHTVERAAQVDAVKAARAQADYLRERVSSSRVDLDSLSERFSRQTANAVEFLKQLHQEIEGHRGHGRTGACGCWLEMTAIPKLEQS